MNGWPSREGTSRSLIMNDWSLLAFQNIMVDFDFFMSSCSSRNGGLARISEAAGQGSLQCEGLCDRFHPPHARKHAYTHQKSTGSTRTSSSTILDPSVTCIPGATRCHYKRTQHIPRESVCPLSQCKSQCNVSSCEAGLKACPIATDSFQAQKLTGSRAWWWT